MARATSRVIVRAWNKEGYHRDIAVFDTDQRRMTDSRVEEVSAEKLIAGNCGATRVVIDPKKFPEMVEFEVLTEEYLK